METKKKNKVIDLIKKQGIILALVLIVAIFALLADSFFTIDNMLTILRQVSVIGIVSCGMTFVIIGGNFDLSVGSLISFTCVLTISLHDIIGPIPAMLVALVAGAVSGVLSGFFVGYLNLNSMIVTLGMQQILRAVTLLYTGGEYSILADPEGGWFVQIGKGSVLGIPIPIIIFIVFVIIFELLLKKTVFGSQLMAVGSNNTASRYAGINDKKVLLLTFVISGILSAVGGIVLGARIGSAQNTIAEGYEFDIITGVILGGTSLSGGSGSTAKSLVGIIIMGVLSNGFVMIGFPYYTQWIAQMIIIVVVVWMDIATKRKKVLA